MDDNEGLVPLEPEPEEIRAARWWLWALQDKYQGAFLSGFCLGVIAGATVVMLIGLAIRGAH